MERFHTPSPRRRPTQSRDWAAGHRISVILGTRPEAIKLAPVVHAMAEHARVRVILTGQHKEMVDDLLSDLDLQPDVRLGAMRPRQTLNGLTGRLMEAIGADLDAHLPDAVIVQGDTTTAMCGALAAFHLGIPVAHVEAGLRSGNRTNPFPEEANRRLIAQLTTWHFAPTPRAASNLFREGHDPCSVHMTGNTVIDSLLWVRKKGLGVSAFSSSSPRRLLVTLHRRETQGLQMARVCQAIGAVAEALDMEVVLPMHRSPAVREGILPILRKNPMVRLVEPLGYVDLIATLAHATLVVTDSGGIQEEAPSLGVPVLVARDTTERPEGIEAGCAQLVGTDPFTISSSIRELVTNPKTHAAMARVQNPFGDGNAASRISARMLEDLTGGDDLTAPAQRERDEADRCILI